MFWVTDHQNKNCRLEILLLFFVVEMLQHTTYRENNIDFEGERKGELRATYGTRTQMEKREKKNENEWR